MISFDKVLGHFERGVALVLELVGVVEEAWVILEVVLLTFQEGVQLSKVRSVLSLAIRLRSMVGVHVHIMKVVFSVIHVLAIIDLVVLSLAISDFPGISRANMLVLTEVGTDKWTVCATVILADHHLG